MSRRHDLGTLRQTSTRSYLLQQFELLWFISALLYKLKACRAGENCLRNWRRLPEGSRAPLERFGLRVRGASAFSCSFLRLLNVQTAGTRSLERTDPPPGPALEATTVHKSLSVPLSSSHHHTTSHGSESARLANPNCQLRRPHLARVPLRRLPPRPRRACRPRQLPERAHHLLFRPSLSLLPPSYSPQVEKVQCTTSPDVRRRRRAEFICAACPPSLPSRSSTTPKRLLAFEDLVIADVNTKECAFQTLGFGGGGEIGRASCRERVS